VFFIFFKLASSYYTCVMKKKSLKDFFYKNALWKFVKGEATAMETFSIYFVSFVFPSFVSIYENTS
jgi:hypothetical protein